MAQEDAERPSFEGWRKVQRSVLGGGEAELEETFSGSMEPIFLRLSVEPKEVLDLFDALRKQSVDAITDSPFVNLVRAGSMSALS